MTTKKPNALQAMLGANMNTEREVPIKRLGVNFIVKGLTSAEIEAARAQCTFGTKVREELIEATLIAKACQEPNFADPALIAHYGATDAADCVRKSLYAGEIAKVMTAIHEASGFGEAEEIDFPN